MPSRIARSFLASLFVSNPSSNVVFAVSSRLECSAEKRIKRIDHERMVEEKGRTFLHRTLLFQRSFSPEEEGLDRVIYSGKKPRSISPSLSYSRWIKRPVSRERHFAIIKKRREISLKNNLCSVPSSNEPQFRGKKRYVKRSFIHVPVITRSSLFIRRDIAFSAYRKNTLACNG